MLKKSFKSAKCKTSLMLAVSRIKILKNKKEAQLTQLKGELAKLLEAGQDRTARIRVEHLVREEKLKEAYELIQLFCELIVARLPMIESQKICPIDLKEAVTSVIFASARCGDISELKDVPKHFKNKYGSEFVTAAVELRPECGVNRMLVEKLSAKAPDGQSKIKILSAIAENYSIKWDPKSFSDESSNPPADLLNGPNTFEKATKIQMEPIEVQSSLHHNDKKSSSGQVLSKSDEKPHTFENSRHNLSSAHHYQKSDFTDTNAYRMNVSGHHFSETKPSEIDAEGQQFRPLNYGDQNNYSPGRQHWNMDFKDATSAAQAAAESAERASLAARAAAELSSRGNIYSPQSQKYSSHSSFRDERPQEYVSSNLRDQVTSAPYKNSRVDDNSIENDTERFIEHETKISSNPSLMKSSISNVDAKISASNYPAADTYSPKNSSEPSISDKLGSASSEKQPRSSDVEHVSDQPRFTVPENFENHLNRIPSNEKQGDAIDENPFAVDQTNVSENTVERRFDDETSVVFDDYGPCDDFELEGEYQREESTLNVISPRGKTPINLSDVTDNTWISKQNYYEAPQKSIFNTRVSEESAPFSENPRFDDRSQSDDFFPAAYDHSDGPSSESEEDSKSSKIVGMNSGESSNKQNLFSEIPESNYSSIVSAGSSPEEKRSLMSPSHSSKFSSHNEVEEAIPSSSSTVIQDTSTLEESTSEGYSSLMFGTLKGGRRNIKGNRPSLVNYNSSASGLPSKPAYASKTEKSTSMGDTTFRSSFSTRDAADRNLEELPGVRKGSQIESNSFHSHLGDSNDKFLDSTSRNDQESHGDRVGNEISKKSTSRVSVKYPGFHDDDDSEDSPRHNKNNSPRPVIGLSRRTKASPRSPSTPAEDSNGTQFVHRDGSERKGSRSNYSAAPMEIKTSRNYSDEMINPDQPRLFKPIKKTPETKRPLNEERLKSSRREKSFDATLEANTHGSSNSPTFNFSREKTTSQTLKSDFLANTEEQPLSFKPSKPIHKPQRSKETPLNPSPQSETQAGSESIRKEKASHVHPKLPDYDNFAAHFLSLRQNHK